MEKICSYGFNGFTGEYWYEQPNVLVYRDGVRPSNDEIAKIGTAQGSDAGWDAGEMYAWLSVKQYDKLLPATKKIYDFLTARLGE